MCDVHACVRVGMNSGMREDMWWVSVWVGMNVGMHVGEHMTCIHAGGWASMHEGGCVGAQACMRKDVGVCMRADMQQMGMWVGVNACMSEGWCAGYVCEENPHICLLNIRPFFACMGGWMRKGRQAHVR